MKTEPISGKTGSSIFLFVPSCSFLLGCLKSQESLYLLFRIRAVPKHDRFRQHGEAVIYHYLVFLRIRRVVDQFGESGPLLFWLSGPPREHSSALFRCKAAYNSRTESTATALRSMLVYSPGFFDARKALRICSCYLFFSFISPCRPAHLFSSFTRAALSQKLRNSRRISSPARRGYSEAWHRMQ